MTEVEPGGAFPSRPPLWVTLILGAVVGFGFGAAWERFVPGMALGLVLAVLAWRIFR